MHPGRDRLRIVFMGTPEFAVPSLNALISHEDVIAVVTQPDRKKGRGRVVAPPPVKVLALKNNITVFQPERLREERFIGDIKDLAPELIVVVSYGKILPKSLLEIPAWGCINVHASLLPKYRGAAPITWALLNGEKVTGITTIQMDEGMDTGDIILQREITIDNDDDARSLYDKLSYLGAEVLLETIQLLKTGRLKTRPQDHSHASYAPLLKKEDGIISWRAKAHKIRDFLRGMNPWPGAYTFWKGKRLKIIRGEVIDSVIVDMPGVVKSISMEGIDVSTGNGLLRIIELQMEGKRVMKAGEFIQGYKIKVGDTFQQGKDVSS